MIGLGVNIDHVVTVRQARYRGGDPRVPTPFAEPDSLDAAREAEAGGADGITVHLREDRRHIQDHDVERLRAAVKVRLNLEMAATDEMVKIARRIKPATSMLVPEGRMEVTTEGGLDVAGNKARLREVVKALRDGGMLASAFIDADERQIAAAKEAGFDICEVHTGPYAHAHAVAHGDARNATLARELEAVRRAGELIRAAGMRFNAGHALNYKNVQPIAALPGVVELHIGHAIVSHAVFVGLRQAVAEMKRLVVEAAGKAPR